MRASISFLFTLFLALPAWNPAVAQPNLQWVFGTSGIYSWPEGNNVAVDSTGNIYTTGSFDNTVDFDPGPGTHNLTSAGGTDIFVRKVDANGDFVWAVRMGGSGYDAGRGLAVDGSGNVYTTGYFYGTVDFDPGPGTSNLTSAGGTDIFVQKLDSAGSLVWAKAMGGTSDEQAYGVAVDGSGNVYTTGYFFGTADFDPSGGTFNLTAAGNDDIFVHKLDASGNLAWAVSMGASSSDQGFAVAVDGSGNVHTVGRFQGTVDFDPGAGTASRASAGSFDVFIQKLDSTGALVWAASMGGTGQDHGYDLAVDASGNVYSTGSFLGTADFDPSGGTTNLVSAGVYDVFVQQLDSSGALVWAKRMGGTSSDTGYGLALDASGNAYTAGEFAGTVDFDPGAGTFDLTSAGSNDIFIQKLDATGTLGWAVGMGGTSIDRAYSIAVDATGNIYTQGQFSGTVDFDPGPGVFNVSTVGGTNLFLHRLGHPPLDWAVSMSGNSWDGGFDVAVDAFGNVYTTGLFQATVDFDPGTGTYNLTSLGSDDAYVQKLDKDGALVWAVRMGGGSWDGGSGIALDASGNVYTTGYFEGTVDFDPGAGTFNLTSAGAQDIFVQKLDGGGNFVWAKRMGGTSYDQGKDVAVDNLDNVYTTGTFEGTADFDPGPGSLNLDSAGGRDIFIHKLDSSGNVAWSVRMGGTSQDRGYGIAVDGSGHVHTTGLFKGTVDFDPGSGSFNLTSSGDDIYVQKLDSSGNFIWAAQVGPGGHDSGYDLALDSSGNVYTTGVFAGTADFDPGAGTFNLTSAGDWDIFVQKLDSAGDLVWARRTGGTARDSGLGLALDTSGNVYTTGFFQGTVDFDPEAGTFNLTSSGGEDIFVQKLDSGGSLVWAVGVGGASNDRGNSVAVDGSANVHTTGYFEGTVDFDPGTGTFDLTSTAAWEIFVQKLGLVPLPPEIKIEKSESIDPVVAGSGAGNLTYTISASNIGAGAATGLEVTETLTLPAGVTVQSVTPSGSTMIDGTTSPITWTIGNLASTASETLTVVLTVASNAAQGTDVISDTAAVSALDQTDPNSANDSATESTSILRKADVAVTKTDGVTAAVPGQDSVVYTIAVTNNGPSDDASVSVADTFPAGLACSWTSVVAGGATGNSSSSGAALGDTLSMPSASSVTYTVTCSIASGATGTLSNTATATASVTDEVSGNNSATDNDTVLAPEADLSITKTDDADPVPGGSQVTYTITVNNAGPSDSQGVVVTDTLPAGVTLSSTSGCAEDPNGVPTCTLGTIAASGSKQFTVKVDVDLDTTGTITNQASVSATTTDGNGANDSTSETTDVSSDWDYGDAPDPTYSTLAASSGARHLQPSTLYLGGAVDVDTDGQPTATADGDDLDAGGDDEDGVVFTSGLRLNVISTTTSVNVTSSAVGLLNAWVDFNADGDWGDGGEQIFIDEALAVGVNALTFDVPPDAELGSTFARFRASTTGGFSYDGSAGDGEVEDYAVEITPDDDLDLFNMTLSEDRTYYACNSITAGGDFVSFPDLSILAPAKITFHAGNFTLIKNGLFLEIGADLKVTLGAVPGCP